MRLFFLFFFTAFFYSCGLPDASSFQDIQSPIIIQTHGYPKCSYENGNPKITIELMVFNQEDSFSGYNVFVNTNASTLAYIKSDLDAQVSLHTVHSSGFDLWNENIAHDRIIKNKKTFPTLPINKVPSDYKLKPTYVLLEINHLPEGISGGGAFAPDTSYGFGLTGISIPNIKESNISNVLRIRTSSSANPDTCGLVEVSSEQTF